RPRCPARALVLGPIHPTSCRFSPSCGSINGFAAATASTPIYTLSLHDALPISHFVRDAHHGHALARERHHRVQHLFPHLRVERRDRKSTRLNSSHVKTSYAVFCLKKRKRLPAATPHARARQKQRVQPKNGSAHV